MICHKQIIPTKLHFLLYWQLVKSIGVLPNVFLQYEELKSKILLMALHHTHDGF